LYLLMPLGLKGGFALAQSGLTGAVLVSQGAALGMAVLVSVLGYLWVFHSPEVVHRHMLRLPDVGSSLQIS
jgi:hypothetical protein